MALGPFATGQLLRKTLGFDARTTPCTLSVWFNVLSGTSQRGLMFMGMETSSTQGTGLDVSGSKLRFTQNVTDGRVEAPGNFALGTWNHACGIARALASRSVYLNGAGADSTQGSGSPGLAQTDLILAARNGGTNSPIYAADIMLAEAAVWVAELTPSEVSSLAKGYPARLIRPSSLVFYRPLIRDDEGLTRVGGTVVAAPHPRRIY